MELVKAFASVMLGWVVVMSTLNGMAAGDCIVQNNSEQTVIIVSLDANLKGIEVRPGSTMPVPPPHRHCYFKNGVTGHTMGPVTLDEGTLVVIVNGVVSCTVDVYVAIVNLLGTLELGTSLFMSL